MQFDRLDLNLLRVLDALLETASISRTAERIHLSPPAASRAVTRLRQALGDALVVRSGAGYVLTPAAVALREPVRRLMEQLAQVFEPARFDPSRAERRFALGSTDYGTAVVLPGLVARLAAVAPGCRLSIAPWSTATLDDLQRGELDAALYADEALPPDFHARDLFVDRYVAVVRQGHPIDRGAASAIDLETLAHYPHIAPSHPSGRRLVTDDLLARHGVRGHRIVLDGPYFVALPQLIGATDLVLLAPSRLLGRALSGAGLIGVELARSVTFSYRLVWHERAHRDPAFTWLREELVASLQSG